MDGVTHAIAGLLAGELCEEPEKCSRRRRFFWAAISLAPDLDGMSGVGGPLYYFAYHRRIFHGLPGILFLALCGGFLYDYLGLGGRKRGLFLSLIALLVHLFLDLATSFGTTLFYPFMATDYSLDLLFIVDLLFSGLLLSFSFLQIYKGMGSKKWAIAGVLVAIFYIFAAAFMRHRALELIGREVSEKRYPQGLVSIIPQPPSIFHWALFIKTENGYWAGTISLLDEKSNLRLYEEPKRKKLAHIASTTEAGKRFLAFARFPHLIEICTKDGVTYKFIDLRFQISGKEKANYYFGSTVKLANDGTVLEQGLTNR